MSKKKVQFNQKEKTQHEKNKDRLKFIFLKMDKYLLENDDIKLEVKDLVSKIKEYKEKYWC